MIRPHQVRCIDVCYLAKIAGQQSLAVEGLINDEAIWITQADRLLVANPCVHDTGQRLITAVDATGRQQYHQAQMVQLV